MSDLKKSDLGNFSGGGAVIGSPVALPVKLLSMDFCSCIGSRRVCKKEWLMNPLDLGVGDIDQIQ